MFQFVSTNSIKFLCKYSYYVWNFKYPAWNSFNTIWIQTSRKIKFLSNFVVESINNYSLNILYSIWYNFHSSTKLLSFNLAIDFDEFLYVSCSFELPNEWQLSPKCSFNMINYMNYYNNRHTYIHNWPLQPFRKDYDLASHTVVCVHFIRE